MTGNHISLMAFYWTVFATSASRAVILTRKFYCLSQPYIPSWHYYIKQGVLIYFQNQFLFQRFIISAREPTFKVFPFLPSTLSLELFFLPLHSEISSFACFAFAEALPATSFAFDLVAFVAFLAFCVWF